MRVKRFKVRNFTSLVDVDLADLPDLVVFIGKNSAGKSNLLDALALFFVEFGTDLERNVGTQEYLFANHDIEASTPLEIAATVTLSSEEWAEILQVDQSVAKQFESKELHLAKRLTANQGVALWRTYEVRFETLDVVRGGELIDIDTEFFLMTAGDDWPDSAELHVNQFVGRLGPLLQANFGVLHTTESTRSWPDRFLQRPTILESDHVAALRDLSQSSGRQRQVWLAVTRRYEDLAPNRQRPVAVGSSIELEEGNLSVPIGMTGEGSQAMFRLIDHLERSPQILVIEEPETHLHPAFIKKVGRSLVEAANKGKQLFVCTHSPFLIDQSSLDSLFVVKNEGRGTQVSPMRDIDDLRNLLLDIGMRPSDILFCDAVLLVDGLSDEIFFDALSNKIGAPLAECHVKLVKANGKSRGTYKIEFWAEVGRDAGIPIYVILDKDAKEEAADAESKGHIRQEQYLILSQGALEDCYPWDALKKAVSSLCGQTPPAEIPAGKRIPELKKLLDTLGPGNAWKCRLAEEVARHTTRENAESDMPEVVGFLRKIRADLGVE